MQLSDLVGPTAPLLAQWPTKPLLWHNPPDAFDELITLPEIDVLIDAECLAMRNLVLIKDHKPVERHLFGTGEMPNRGAVRKHLDEGGTVSLRQLQTVKPSLSELQKAIQAETGCGVHVNAYITPAHNQGFTYHYDPYVTLIVQLHGRKTWAIHPPFFERPMKEYGNFLVRGFTDEQWHFLANTPPAESYTLAPGDVFWLPRGYAHSPYTEGEATSLHLTFALKERTLHWLAEQMTESLLDMAIQDPALRAEIVPAELTAGPQAAVKYARDYLIGSLLRMDLEQMSERGRTAALRPA
ncbi:transcription factor jumonji jmjC domain-containing protein [Actinobacteria bacterium OV450]|nr:transcription factor jumonji jmjC domain-containing protein [Actinobacteria bacterium OV450]